MVHGGILTMAELTFQTQLLSSIMEHGGMYMAAESISAQEHL